MILQPVILCGGSGTRLWPLSRQSFPKQFLPLIGDETMLQQTARRLDGLASTDTKVAEAAVVCNEAHRFLVAEQFREMGRKTADILLEPVGRNTAPALTLAALAAPSEEDPVLVVMPADHLVANLPEFSRAVSAAAKLAEQGKVVTLGIVPQSPETGYGYIRRGGKIDDQAYALSEFVEKPDEKTAQTYLDSGDYYWNSGIFVLRASVWLQQIENHRADILSACTESMQGMSHDGDFTRVDKELFSACPSDSIDYAVMERIAALGNDLAAVIPLDAGWSDIGAWAALWEAESRDENGNVVRGDTLTKDSRNNLLISEHRLVAAVGIEGLVVVETADAVLVADKSRAQDVKAITEQLKQQGRDECVFQRRVHRPWGSFEGIDNGSRFQVKRLTVNPGATLSLQMHHHRAEHWIVVSGTAEVTRGEDVFMLSENESTYIPLGTKHRLANPGTIPLEIIEIQSGSYLGEDDIVRFEDVYQRSSSD